MCPHNCYKIVSPGHTHARFTRTLHLTCSITRPVGGRPPRARRVHGAPGGGFGGDTRPTVIRFVLRPLILNQTQWAKVDCCVRATPPADELNNPRVFTVMCAGRRYTYLWATQVARTASAVDGAARWFWHHHSDHAQGLSHARGRGIWRTACTTLREHSSKSSARGTCFTAHGARHECRHGLRGDQCLELGNVCSKFGGGRFGGGLVRHVRTTGIRCWSAKSSPSRRRSSLSTCLRSDRPATADGQLIDLAFDAVSGWKRMLQWTLSEPRLEGGLPLEGEHCARGRGASREASKPGAYRA